MRLVFMGTPAFSVPALEALAQAGHEILAVYTQPPRPAGRGKKDRASQVQRAATQLGLDVRTPKTLRDPVAQSDLAALNADLAVVVAYGLILPQAVLDAPRFGCLNIHASLLPRWRGAAPIHRAILAGDEETGVCIMQMEAGLDTGPVLLERRTPIGARETVADLHDRLSQIGAAAIVETLDQLQSLTPKLQPKEGVTYAEKIDKAEARIDWRRPAHEVDRQIRGLSPFPGAWSTIHGKRVKMLRSGLAEGHGPPGEVIQTGPRLTIACTDGAVSIDEVQAEGRGRQTDQDFLRGARLSVGDRFGELD